MSFFKPFSTFYIQGIEKWLRKSPSRQVTQYQIARLFGDAYERATRINNVTKGFRVAGVWPVDRNVFPSYMFEAADTLNKNQSELIPQDSSSTEQKENQHSTLELHTSKSTKNITKSLTILSPIPENNVNKRRAVQKAAEITASPYKLALEGSIQRKEKAGKIKKQCATKTSKRWNN